MTRFIRLNLLAVLVPTVCQAGARLPMPPDSNSASEGGEKSGLHLPHTTRVNFERNMTDGGGFRWNIQHYGTVGQGTNYAYSGGLYCQVNGSNVRSSGYGWANKAGDEIEIGPYNRNNLQISRRIKVYRDLPLARWMDIFENPMPQDVTVQVNIYTNTNWPVVTTTGITDGWAFITEAMAGGQNTPALLHIVADKRSKIRPTIQIEANQIFVRYSVTVPARGTTVLCYFESQNHSTDDHLKMVKDFKPSQLLKDLPQSVRKLIMNFSTAGGVEGLELERSETFDTVTLRGGDPMYGTVGNETFRVQTFLGPLDVPAAKVVGMTAGTGPEEQVRALLVDGQILCGLLPEAKLVLNIADGGSLQVPFDRIQQWSYRVSDTRPDETPFHGPIAILRSGDRVAFDPAQVQMMFRTRHGTVKLDGKDMLSVSLDNPGNAVHRAFFLNGSKLAGFLEPEKVVLPLKLGPHLEVSRDIIAGMQFALEDKVDGTLTQAVLSNGDELYGRLVEEKIEIQSEFGSVQLNPAGIKSMTFSSTCLGQVRLEMWNGSVYRGQLAQKDLTFEIIPGPTLKVYAGQFASIIRPQPLPPGQLREQVEKLVARLASESYKDRQAATEELKKLGPAIVPLLQKASASDDPEVKQRIEDILEHLGGKGSGAGNITVTDEEGILVQ